MARRKTFLASLVEAQQRRAAERERARVQELREQQRMQEKLEREAVAEAKAKKRDQEKREREAARRREQEERDRIRAKTQAEQAAKRAEREKAQKVAQAERERKAREREAEQARIDSLRQEASERTERIDSHLNEIHRVLIERATSLRSRSHEISDAFNSSGPSSAAERIKQLIEASPYPEGCLPRITAELHPQERQLMVDAELPRQEIIPDVVSYRFASKAKEIRPETRKIAETKQLYQDAIARITLRCVAELLYVTPAPMVNSAIVNGFVSTKDKATGQPTRPCVISVEATRETMDEIVLDEPELDPLRCLHHLRAIVSPHPFDLEPVKPVAYFDPAKYKLVDEIGAVSGLDSRIDLLTLSPVEFEHLMQRLFEAVGLKSWVRNTQISRDEGIDAVAINEDPLVGGECVIQAKRYKAIVGLESVHALAGAMSAKSATRGILVTTSWFGKASRDFASDHGRIQLIDGRNLKSMLAEHLGLDVLISLPKLPPGWERDEVS